MGAAWGSPGTYDGGDPDGYALAVNITRRHLTTGARASIAAQARRLNGMSTREVGTEANLPQRRITDANLILYYGEHDLASAPGLPRWPSSRQRARWARTRQAPVAYLASGRGLVTGWPHPPH